MLLSFSVSNFRSFYGEQTLSMVASTRQPDHPEHLSPIPGDENKALPVAVLYGANGAGKSNLVKAIAFLEDLICKGTTPNQRLMRQPFILNSNAATEPSMWRIQFVDGGRVYEFGMEIIGNVIAKEWLSFVDNGRERPIYERITREDEEVIIEAGDALRDGRHAKALALTQVGVLPNQLFLFAVGSNLRKRDQGPLLSSALHWFFDGLVTIQPHARFDALEHLASEDRDFAEFAGGFLASVATGVHALKVETEESTNFESVLATAPLEVRQTWDKMSEGEEIFFRVGEHPFVVKKEQGAKLKRLMLVSEHIKPDGQRVAMPFSEESDGTKRLLHLLPALHAIARDVEASPRVFIIDEIDRSLHPLLAKGFVREFLSHCSSKQAQLIFTTHELAFMDLDLLRRDEIWFASKKMPEGSTELYSLSDYKVRTDLRVDKAYLQGRFGAIPPIEAELPDWVQTIMNDLRPGSAAANAGERKAQ